ncbi:hypothetical protein NLC26_01860 [Candidatus Aminicenantes bacterium AC-708-M15]|jgi:hypothetical protein|nr:hypothetical protein [SCandidatus Aminicenantes bacterium Aminicenantia_JdfR_composite]MCP2604208.1 hypothetical protein [Candidatus Aminicenantes bacterium AC-708-M15]MCP2606368.1 hypothetical protein [Candidatus Aminicenantes bacterium AC-708-I09]MCP2618620.1 hypothetical protein [Candidatus Aminicenantes bacterium AC-335-A11]MCP2620979.1 hypothetical protein [Candidatus Aminicenantes bacterium AC-334-E05]
MKKYLFLILIFLILIFPLFVKADCVLNRLTSNCPGFPTFKDYSFNYSSSNQRVRAEGWIEVSMGIQRCEVGLDVECCASPLSNLKYRIDSETWKSFSYGSDW